MFSSQSLKSRLLLPVLVAVLAISLLQFAAGLLTTRSGIDGMVSSVVDTQQQGSTRLTEELQRSNQTIETAMTRLEQGVKQSLTQTLQERLGAEQQRIRKTLVDAVHDSAQESAQLMSLVAPEAIWDQDSPKLTQLVRDLHRNPQVVFAGYYAADGKPLTRFLDRTNPQIKAFISSGQGASSLDRVVDAAQRDPAVFVVDMPINPKGEVIGRFVLGVSEEKVVAQSNALDAQFARLIEQTGKGVSALIAAEADAARTALQQSLEGAVDVNRQTGSELQQVVSHESARLSTRLTTVQIVSALLLVVALLAVMTWRITSKILTLTRALEDLAAGEGDLTHRISINSRDEIADMAAAVNQFVAKTQGLVRSANQAADDTVTHIQTMERLSQQASESSSHQQQQVEQVSQAMVEMLSAVHQVAERIQQNLSHVDQIRSASGEASDISSAVKQNIQTLVEEVTHAAAVVNQVEQQSGKIEEVLNMITAIADQTNLLALNAAIEAARAGDLGRGFAVVADEVRALASKTQQSTADIRARIDELQRATREAVQVIGLASDKAQHGIVAMESSDERMHEVSASVSGLFDLTNDIAAMAEEQSQVGREVNLSVEQIRVDGENSAAAVKQNRQASAELAALAESLKRTLSQFKV
ncbi:MAG TPA: methyl-accepting chemotaxis protein [Motiliproteus sp.]